MYKMLIAEQDDEQIEMLKVFTESTYKDVKIVGVEKSGGATLKYLEENHVDILVVAMNLEGISGLEVVRNVRKNNQELHIIIISSYDYSYFVMEAIKYDVKDYLLKPVNEVEYMNTMDKIVAELEQKKVRKEKKCELEHREHQIDIFSDYSFVYSFLWNNQNMHLLKLYKQILGLDKYGFVLNLEYVRKGDECVLDVDRDIMIIHQGIKDVIKEQYSCVVGPRIGNRIIVYISQKEKSEKHVAMSIANMLKDSIKRCFDVEMKIGIGSMRRIEEVYDSYVEAIKSLRYIDGEGIVYSKDIEMNMLSHKNYMELETKFLQSAKFGKQECLEHFADLLKMLQPLKLQDKKNKIFELIVLVCREVRVQGEGETEHLDYLSYLKEIEPLDWNDLKRWAYVKIEYSIKKIRVSRGGRKSAAVKEALEYINEHYSENLALKVISNIVGVTPQHFSKIFKEETKYKYVDWLTKVRLEKAKELLLEGGKTIYEISDEVGYKDSNYFSRIFKKTIGVPPTVFAKMDVASNNQ